jgi:hypothetical protein
MRTHNLLVNVRVSPSCTLVWVQMDSGHRNLKNILIAISSQTILDPSWEASRPWATTLDYLDSDLWRRPWRRCFRLPPGLSTFILFSLYVYLLVSLLWLVYIVKPLYYYSSVLKPTSFTPNSFPQSLLSFLDLSTLLSF